jgi:hypothetical protein
MTKPKVFELKIEDEDELSGIDSISLVDEPAIEVNWIAFKKDKDHDFHIPDGEDETYLDRLMAYAQDEQELLDDGYVFDRIVEEDEKLDFATEPNATSKEDGPFYRVRYKYGLSPNISQSAIISTTRQFCRDLINKNFVWREEDIESITNDFGDSARKWRGGYNCRHKWFKMLYKKDVTIINKASINKGKVEGPLGIAIDTLPDFNQPSTVTGPTQNNPSPSTVRNLGLSKEEDFAGMKVSLDYDGTLSTLEGKLLAQRLISQGYTVYVVTSRQDTSNAAAIYRRAEEVGIPRSRVYFTNGRPKLPTLRQLGIRRHYDNNPDVINEINKTPVGIQGVKFDYQNGLPSYVDQIPKKKKGVIEKSLAPPTMFESHSDYPESVKNNAKAVLKWVEENGWGSCGTDVGKQRANQLANGEPISEETIQRMYSYLSRHEVDLESSKSYDDGCGKLMYDSWGGKTALSWAESKINTFEKEKMSKQRFQTDDEKRIVLGPAMIPEMRIFRKDKSGNPYYVYFSAETIKMIAEKYMRNKYIDNNDTEHNGKAVKDVYVMESWIKEDSEDKSNKYGYNDLPIGTWFVSMKIKNDEVWKQVKDGILNGFSVSGYFEEVAEFKMEEMFLEQLAQILKNVKE